MRVVADTNTVVSALRWGGLPAGVLAAARAEHIALFTSAALLAELEEVLARAKFAVRIAHVGTSAQVLVAGYQALVTPMVAATIDPTSRDPDDDQLSGCALGANAELIVTRDHDLLSLHTFRDIRILSARDALALIAAREQ